MSNLKITESTLCTEMSQTGIQTVYAQSCNDDVRYQIMMSHITIISDCNDCSLKQGKKV